MGVGDEGKPKGTCKVASLPPGRAHGAWQAWLQVLADDAEAALAAALTYEALAPAEREAWLDALDEDAPEILAPRESLYAPLLLVEEDETRRARIASRCGDAQLRGTPRAWSGMREDGVRVCVVVSPLWLRFVETLALRVLDRGGASSSRSMIRCARVTTWSTPSTAGAELERADRRSSWRTSPTPSCRPSATGRSFQPLSLRLPTCSRPSAKPFPRLARDSQPRRSLRDVRALRPRHRAHRPKWGSHTGWRVFARRVARSTLRNEHLRRVHEEGHGRAHAAEARAPVAQSKSTRSSLSATSRTHTHSHTRGAFGHGR